MVVSCNPDRRVKCDKSLNLFITPEDVMLGKEARIKSRRQDHNSSCKSILTSSYSYLIIFDGFVITIKPTSELDLINIETKCKKIQDFLGN